MASPAPAAHSALVAIKRNGEDGARFDFSERSWATVGTHEDSDIRVQADGVALLHAMVTLSDGSGPRVYGLDVDAPVRIPARGIELCSSTFAPLHHDDVFYCGERGFRFIRAASAAAGATPAKRKSRMSMLVTNAGERLFDVPMKASDGPVARARLSMRDAGVAEIVAEECNLPKPKAYDAPEEQPLFRTSFANINVAYADAETAPHPKDEAETETVASESFKSPAKARKSAVAADPENEPPQTPHKTPREPPRQSTPGRTPLRTLSPAVENEDVMKTPQRSAIIAAPVKTLTASPWVAQQSEDESDDPPSSQDSELLTASKKARTSGIRQPSRLYDERKSGVKRQSSAMAPQRNPHVKEKQHDMTPRRNPKVPQTAAPSTFTPRRVKKTPVPVKQPNFTPRREKLQTPAADVYASKLKSLRTPRRAADDKPLATSASASKASSASSTPSRKPVANKPLAKTPGASPPVISPASSHGSAGRQHKVFKASVDDALEDVLPKRSPRAALAHGGVFSRSPLANAAPNTWAHTPSFGDRDQGARSNWEAVDASMQVPPPPIEMSAEDKRPPSPPMDDGDYITPRADDNEQLIMAAAADVAPAAPEDEGEGEQPEPAPMDTSSEEPTAEPQPEPMVQVMPKKRGARAESWVPASEPRPQRRRSSKNRRPSKNRRATLSMHDAAVQPALNAAKTIAKTPGKTPAEAKPRVAFSNFELSKGPHYSPVPASAPVKDEVREPDAPPSRLAGLGTFFFANPEPAQPPAVEQAPAVAPAPQVDTLSPPQPQTAESNRRRSLGERLSSFFLRSSPTPPEGAQSASSAAADELPMQSPSDSDVRESNKAPLPSAAEEIAENDAEAPLVDPGHHSENSEEEEEEEAELLDSETSGEEEKPRRRSLIGAARSIASGVLQTLVRSPARTLMGIDAGAPPEPPAPADAPLAATPATAQPNVTGADQPRQTKSNLLNQFNAADVPTGDADLPDLHDPATADLDEMLVDVAADVDDDEVQTEAEAATDVTPTKEVLLDAEDMIADADDANLAEMEDSEAEPTPKKAPSVRSTPKKSPASAKPTPKKALSAKSTPKKSPASAKPTPKKSPAPAADNEVADDEAMGEVKPADEPTDAEEVDDVMAEPEAVVVDDDVPDNEPQAAVEENDAEKEAKAAQEEAPEPTDYSKWTVKELRLFLKGVDVEISSRAKKADLIELAEKATGSRVEDDESDAEADAEMEQAEDDGPVEVAGEKEEVEDDANEQVDKASEDIEPTDNGGTEPQQEVDSGKLEQLREELTGRKMTELRELLAQLGLEDKSRRKADLVKRLVDHDYAKVRAFVNGSEEEEEQQAEEDQTEDSVVEEDLAPKEPWAEQEVAKEEVENATEVDEGGDVAAQDARREELEGMTVKQLQVLIRKLKLDKSGKKSDLVDRIVAHEHSEQDAEGPEEEVAVEETPRKSTRKAAPEPTPRKSTRKPKPRLQLDADEDNEEKVDLDKLKVAQLREYLRKHNAETTGKKKELLERAKQVQLDNA